MDIVGALDAIPVSAFFVLTLLIVSLAIEGGYRISLHARRASLPVWDRAFEFCEPRLRSQAAASLRRTPFV
jgi:hypothetical protein